MRSTHTFNINAYGAVVRICSVLILSLNYTTAVYQSVRPGSGTHTEVLVSIPNAGRHRSTGVVGVITRQNSVGVAATEVERRRDMHIHSQTSE